MKTNEKIFYLIGIAEIALILMVSGCMEEKNNKNVADNTTIKDIIKHNIETEYDFEIMKLKTITLKEASENDELIENETNEILKNITKEEILKNAKEYGLSDEDVEYIKNLNSEEFEKFKNETLRLYAIDKAKEDIMNAFKEIVEEYNYTILDIKPKDKIRDVDMYLDSYFITNETKEDIKKKLNNGSYIVIIEMNVAEKFNTAEVCDEKGNLIK